MLSLLHLENWLDWFKTSLHIFPFLMSPFFINKNISCKHLSSTSFYLPGTFAPALITSRCQHLWSKSTFFLASIIRLGHKRSFLRKTYLSVRLEPPTHSHHFSSKPSERSPKHFVTFQSNQTLTHSKWSERQEKELQKELDRLPALRLSRETMAITCLTNLHEAIPKHLFGAASLSRSQMGFGVNSKYTCEELQNKAKASVYNEGSTSKLP